MTELALVMLIAVVAFFIGLGAATGYCSDQVAEAERKMATALDELAAARGETIRMQREMLMLHAWWQGGDDDDGGEDIAQVVDIYLN